MKKFLLFGAIALISLSSCREDEENVPTRLTEIPVSILGKWSLTHYTIVSGKTDATLATQNVSTCEADTTLEFFQNGTARAHYFLLLLSVCTDLGVIDAPYTYNSSSKILKFDGDDIQVVTLKTDQLTFVDSEYNLDSNNDGVKDKRYVSYKR